MRSTRQAETFSALTLSVKATVPQLASPCVLHGALTTCSRCGRANEETPMNKTIPMVLLTGALSLATLPVLAGYASAQEPPSAPSPSDSMSKSDSGPTSGSSSKMTKKHSAKKKKHKSM
jgi:hypothetical protein